MKGIRKAKRRRRAGAGRLTVGVSGEPREAP